MKTTNALSFVQFLLQQQCLDNSRVMEMISLFTNNTDETLRILSYLSGHTNKPEVPETSTIERGATLISYDFFKNKVEYKYIATEKFQVAEDVEEPIVLFNSWADVPYELKSKRGTGTKIINVDYVSKNRCSLEEWLGDK